MMVIVRLILVVTVYTWCILLNLLGVPLVLFQGILGVVEVGLNSVGRYPLRLLNLPTPGEQAEKATAGRARSPWAHVSWCKN